MVKQSEEFQIYIEKIVTMINNGEKSRYHETISLVESTIN